MNTKILAATLIISLMVIGGFAAVKAGELEANVIAEKLAPHQKPDVQLDEAKLSLIIEVTITGARENGGQLYVTYVAKINGEETIGSIDAPLDADSETVMQLAQADILKTIEKAPVDKNVETASLVGLRETATAAEILDKFYPKAEPTLIEKIITP